ncbi:MAG: sulfurtransferase TusA family protein [Bacilli bacterium]
MEKMTLDAKGMACPLPVIHTKKAIATLATDEVLKVETTDKGARNDLTAWAKSNGHAIVHSEESGTHDSYWIKKG